MVLPDHMIAQQPCWHYSRREVKIYEDHENWSISVCNTDVQQMFEFEDTDIKQMDTDTDSSLTSFRRRNN
jgi:hypothetical protein